MDSSEVSTSLLEVWKDPMPLRASAQVLEERRENPGPYDDLRKDAEQARAKLKEEGPNITLSLSSMIGMFREIYSNTNYGQDPWKIGMHLSEEIGEATIELSRLELAWRGRRRGFEIKESLAKVYEYSEGKIEIEVDRLRKRNAEPRNIEQRARVLRTGLEQERAAFMNREPWEVFRELVSEKLKEEIADVFSWLSAVLATLDPRSEISEEQRIRFVNESGQLEYLKCAWCGKDACDDKCLVEHSISSEIVEKVSKF